jgi:hypothetical protein
MDVFIIYRYHLGLAVLPDESKVGQFIYKMAIDKNHWY